MGIKSKFQQQSIPRRAGVSMLAASVLSAGLFFGVKGFNMVVEPGPLSAVQEQGTPLGGFNSHADFEQECGHCHAPVHCITATRCQDCHMEVAQDRLNAEGLHGRLPASQCQVCHVEHQGREAVITEFAFRNVDHAKLSGFSLAYHLADYDGHPLTCESCHSQDRFRSKTLDCVSCHAEADHEFVAGHIELYGTDCIPCHDGQDRMQGFDHAVVYPLTGGHEALECTDCHAGSEFYPAPRACAACHADPEIHLGVFGTDCNRCHEATAWQPARLTRHLFALNHGAEADHPCERCHTESYAAYTCYECHDHDQQEDRRLHAQEGLVEIEACVDCHPTGAAGEAARFQAVGNLADDLPPAKAGTGEMGSELPPGKSLQWDLPKDGARPGPQEGVNNDHGQGSPEGHPGALNNP